MNSIRIRAMLGALLLGLGASAAPGQETAPLGETDLRIAGPVLMVGDLERSLRFYTEGLGMLVGSQFMRNSAPGATVVDGGPERSPFILLLQRDPTARTVPPVEIGQGLSRIMVTVADAKAVAARLRSAGYQPGVPSARNIFFVTDPDGYRFEVMQDGSR